ncbi:MAG: hypothetical protein LBP22_14590 [Deltaproteobacteria bacterium]|nr:hypothetical protein [Deltaproteobacteria bacterium]
MALCPEQDLVFSFDRLMEIILLFNREVWRNRMQFSPGQTAEICLPEGLMGPASLSARRLEAPRRRERL